MMSNEGKRIVLGPVGHNIENIVSASKDISTTAAAAAAAAAAVSVDLKATSQNTLHSTPTSSSFQRPLIPLAHQQWHGNYSNFSETVNESPSASQSASENLEEDDEEDSPSLLTQLANGDEEKEEELTANLCSEKQINSILPSLNINCDENALSKKQQVVKRRNAPRGIKRAAERLKTSMVGLASGVIVSTHVNGLNGRVSMQVDEFAGGSLLFQEDGVQSFGEFARKELTALNNKYKMYLQRKIRAGVSKRARASR